MGDDQSFVDNPLRITCADAIELVTDYLDDALVRADLEDFSTHLSRCEACRVFVDQTRRTVRLTAQHGRDEVEVQPANFDELVGRLRRRQR